MKKVLFLQIKGKSKAGVWYVNKTVAEELIKNGYDVTILSIRNNPGDIVLEHDSRLKLHTINEKDLWEISRKHDIKSFKTLKIYLEEHKLLNEDYEKAKEYIRNLNPDYIIASHYQCLDFVPKEFYSSTLHEQHSSMKDVKYSKANLIQLKKYNNKIFGMIWLSKEIKKAAEKLGFVNNYCIYNPVRINNNKIANVESNKKLVCITRIENTQKRINLMIKIANEVLDENSEWSFELYGDGVIDNESNKIIESNNKIKYMGHVEDIEKVLLGSSINLNTSKFEGFSLSILEAAMCGIPTISFNFGESVYDEILDSKNGYIIENDDINKYIEKLKYLMNNPKDLKKMSIYSKEFAKQFSKEKIIKDWIDLFEKIDKKNIA